MAIPRKGTFNGVEFDIDFSDDEVDRRVQELIRRCGKQKPTFDMETGQPYEGDRLSDDELRRRGYEVEK